MFSHVFFPCFPYSPYFSRGCSAPGAILGHRGAGDLSQETGPQLCFAAPNAVLRVGRWDTVDARCSGRPWLHGRGSPEAAWRCDCDAGWELGVGKRLEHVGTYIIIIILVLSPIEPRYLPRLKQMLQDSAGPQQNASFHTLNLVRGFIFMGPLRNYRPKVIRSLAQLLRGPFPR